MSGETDRWRRVDALCQAALILPEAERTAFVLESSDDLDVRREVQALLAHTAAAERFLESPIGAAAASVLPAAITSLSGTRVGVFEVGALLGAGGMGDVYRARDARLNRDVALKILPLTFALNPDRLDWFRREAQALASLNHPNIGAIYGFEETGGVYALVLELVEGPTLAERLEQGPLPLVEALPIAHQLAEALEFAHEHGIVHNDFKPSNVKLRPDGTVKVLDFGLATVMRETVVNGGDRMQASQSHVPMFGTSVYASPERLKGLGDKRSDIWAFGAVLYEMLAGHPAFPRKVDAVPLADVDCSALAPSTPEWLRHLIQRCLARDVRRRLRDIGEARIALEDQSPGSAAAADTDLVPGPLARVRRHFSWRSTITISGAGLAGAALIGALLPRQAPPAAVRLSAMLPEGQSLSTGDRSVAAISPDGNQIVYVAAPGGLYLRTLSASESKPIPGVDDIISEPVFSPDGQSILFHSNLDQSLKRIPASGGPAVTLCRAVFAYGVSWSDEGIVFFEPGRGILRVSPDGGEPQNIVSLGSNNAAQSPQLLPGGEWLLYTLATGTAPDRWDNARVVIRSLTSGEETTVFTGGSDARYVSTGHLVYAVGGNLFAVPFDLRRKQVAGRAFPAIRGVRRGAAALTGTAQFAVARNGTLVYVPGAPSANWDLGITDRKGTTERLPLPSSAYEAPRVSPDGKRLAFGTDDGKETSVWVYNLDGTTSARRLTFGGNARFPTWSRDGTRVAFRFERDGDAAIFWLAVDGGPLERLTKPGADEAHEPEAWSPTSDMLVFSSRKGSEITLWTLSLNSRAVSRFSDARSSTRTGAAFSPDGRWLAYASSGSSGPTIYVEPFPATGMKHQLVASGDREPHHPLWSPGGTELFYNPGPSRFEAVSVFTAPSFAFGNPVAVPRFFPGASPQTRRPFDVLPDGRFVSPVIASTADAAARTTHDIRVVLNWFSELLASRGN